jgi:UTP--glucose-1-phosphate uridylyltransferase
VAKNWFGDEPFAVVLSDDVIDATPPALKQMIDVFHRGGWSGHPGRTRAAGELSSYGVMPSTSP